MTRPRLGKLLSWALALAALAFVVSAVPLRDRCWDARAPASTRVAVTREASGCVLHLRTGEVRIAASECAALRCEPGVASTFAHARPGVLAAMLLVYALGTLAWAARWRALLRFAGIHLSLVEVWRLSVEAQAGGVLLPGGLGGDAFRIASVVSRPVEPGSTMAPDGTSAASPRHGRDLVAIVVASVLLDRAVGLAVIAAVAAVGGFVWGGAAAGPVAFVLASLPLAFVFGLVLLRTLPLGRVPWLWRGRVGGFVQPVFDYVRDPRAPRAIALAALLSIAVAVAQFVTIRGLVFAVGSVPTVEKWIPLGTAMAFLVGAIPALPGGWGTADAAYVYFFGLAGVEAGRALGVSLLFRMYWYATAVVGAGLQLGRRGARQETSARPAEGSAGP